MAMSESIATARRKATGTISGSRYKRTDFPCASVRHYGAILEDDSDLKD